MHTTDLTDTPTGQVRGHLDRAAGDTARDQALDDLATARPDAVTLAYDAIRAIFDREPHDPDLRFTTDDVWVELGDAGETITEPRSMGVAIRNARRAHLIVPTDNYLPSARPACHSRPVRVWRRPSTGSAF